MLKFFRKRIFATTATSTGIFSDSSSILATASHSTFRYIEVPYKEKDCAKVLGARWDYKRSKWYVPAHLDIRKFNKWVKLPLMVPPAKEAEAQRLGALYDVYKKEWYVSGEQDLTLFANWLVDTVNISPHSAPADGKQNFFAILDLETNDLPVKGQSYRDYTCRIVQISCMLCEGVGTLDEKQFEDIIVKSDGFAIENSQFHGISLERSLSEGVEFSQAADVLFQLLKQAGTVIVHNANFDVEVLRSELHRHGLDEYLKELDRLNVFCSMKQTIQLVGATRVVGNSKRLKYPNLKELYEFSTHKEMQGHHNAKFDVLNLHEALQTLVREGKLSLT